MLITLPTTRSSKSISRQDLDLRPNLKQDTTSTKQPVASIIPTHWASIHYLRRKSSWPIHSLQTRPDHRAPHTRKSHAKMPTSKPKDLQKIENLKSILRSPHKINLVSSSSRNSEPRTVPFCVHGNLFGRYPGALYSCRNDHRSRNPTPTTTTPHSHRSQNSLCQSEEGSRGRGPSDGANNKRAVDVPVQPPTSKTYDNDEEEKREG